MIPKCYGSKSTLHEHYQRWAQAGVFKQIMEILAPEYDRQLGFELEWQSMDGSLVQAPVRKKNSIAEGLGANPTDRGRSGSKIHLQVDGQGCPLGIIVVGANIHDSRLVSQTLEESIVVAHPKNEVVEPDNLCLDKGYDYERVRREVEEHGFAPHIRSRGEEIGEKTHPARRWVVERTFAWLKGFRTIRTRYCQRLKNYLSWLHLASAIILFRKLHNISK